MHIVRDPYGREVRGLRISVTSRCNLRCFYCHREGLEGTPAEASPEVFSRIAEAASALGMEEVKITGGEPLMREDLEDIVSGISEHIPKVSMTTNGVLLADRAASLKQAGLDRVNINLNTLDPETYRRITGTDHISAAIEGVSAAQRAGLEPVKLNFVLMDWNQGHIWDMLEYAQRTGSILQVIELETSRQGERGRLYREHHVPLDDVERWCTENAVGVERRRMHGRVQYTVRYRGGTARIELVKPMHNTHFCMNCTRLRVGPDGTGRTCLFARSGLPLADDPLEGLKRLISMRKPYWREEH